MRLLICGSRHWTDYKMIYEHLKEAKGIEVVIQGGARGADRLAKMAAKKLKISVMTFEAEWKKHGKAAGPIRNQKMLDEGKPSEVWAYPLPDSKGTWDMVERAKKAGISTQVKDEDYNKGGGMECVGDWKMISDNGDVYLKVIDFPVPEDSGAAGESMWVRKTSGTDLEGTGVLDNKPYFSEDVSYGDTVSYAGGTDDEKPHYVGRIELPDEEDTLA